MKISTRSRYGIRALLDVALNRHDEPVSLKSIADRQEVSLPYLEQIIAPLVRSGFLRSIRGPSGGVSLAREPHEIAMMELIKAMEGSITPVKCVDDPTVCSRSESCAACEMWAKIRDAIQEAMQSVTLQDLVDRQRILDASRNVRDT